MNELKDRIRTALQFDLPYFDRELNIPGKPAAVLILISEDEKVLLTRRTDTVETHKGQIAFPGGKMDPGEVEPVQTALREAWEEVGLPRERVEILGEMPPLPVYASHHIVNPVIGSLRALHHEVTLLPQEKETAEIFWVPLKFFLEEKLYSREEREHQGFKYQTHVYQWEHHEIWGATAIMIKNFCDRLKRVA